MKQNINFLFRLALLAIIFTSLWLMYTVHLSNVLNLSVIIGGVLLTYPHVWLGRKILDRRQTIGHAVMTTTFVHFGLGFTFGIPIVRALTTYRDWPGWVLPIPTVIGLILVIISGTFAFLIVINLALKGFGAPFFIVLSKKLATDWMYARTRNPMVLAALSFFLSLGIWFQSLFFLLWVLIIFAPAILFFIKIFEERELEFRFGASYLEYKSKTPFFFPKRTFHTSKK